MDFTRSFVRAKNPCADGFRWFLRHHPDGSDYQGVLDSLVEAGRVDNAAWLLEQFGATHTLVEVDLLEVDALVFAGGVDARRGVDVAGLLRAGRFVRSGGGIHAGDALVAGEDLRAAGAIRAGGPIEAGGDVQARWGIAGGGLLRAGGNLKATGDVRCEGDFVVGGSVHVEGDLHVRGDARVGKGIRVSGDIVVAGAVHAGHGIECAALACGSHLEAGWGVLARGSVRAGGAIRAGESLVADGELQCGEGYGVYAGLAVARSAWESSARVSARRRPAGLLSGWWTAADLRAAGS
jgi:hypothetical protein